MCTSIRFFKCKILQCVKYFIYIVFQVSIYEFVQPACKGLISEEQEKRQLPVK